MAINTIKATIQMRKGLEQDLDSDQLTAGEFAVSTDAKYVRMCFAPGIVIRMATYESFEQDMTEIQTILATCQNIQTAVDAMADLAEASKNAAAASAASSSNSAATASKKAADAASSASNAEDSATAASGSAATASQKAADAAGSADTAVQKSADAANSAASASTSASNAEDSATAASGSAATAFQKAAEAAGNSASADAYAKKSQSYAEGGTGTREGEDTDNAEYYYNQVKHISQGLNGIVNMGNVNFSQLASVDKVVNYMYNVTDAFTSDSTFNDGGGVPYGAGSNVVWTGDGKWDVLAASAVQGIKGDAETSYRQGNVNITKENIGLGNVPNVSTDDQTPTFEQSETRENINSGETLSVILGKIKKWFSSLKTVAFSGLYSDLTGTPEIPTQLPSPESLVFTGASNVAYDGSVEKTVNIPAIPQSLPANGGNADTVGNKNLDYIMDYENATNKPEIPTVTPDFAGTQEELDAAIEGLPVGTIVFLKETSPDYDPILANNTWQEISQASQQGIAKDLWNLGDMKDSYIILGFDHDDLADGSGKAGITFLLMDKTKTGNGAWNNTSSSSVYYNTCTANSELQQYFTDGIYGLADIKPYIKSVLKKYQTNMGTPSTYEEIACNLFLLSITELTGGTAYGIEDEGTIYEYLVSNRSDIIVDFNYWSRTRFHSSTSPKDVRACCGTGGSNALDMSVSTMGTMTDNKIYYRYGFCI